MVDSRPNILCLFSGVGMLSESVALATGGRVIAYAEWEAYAAATLMARMEDASMEPAPVWCGDIGRFDARPFLGVVDIACAGAPCQPYGVVPLCAAVAFSVLAERAGINFDSEIK